MPRHSLDALFAAGRAALPIVVIAATVVAWHPALAQEATPVAPEGVFLPPLPCTVEPRPRAELEGLLATARTATPVSGTPDGRLIGLAEADLPSEPRPDAATEAAIVALEREWAGCFNAFDLPRLFALVTGVAFAVPPAMSPEEVEAAYAAAGSPAAFGSDVGPGDVVTVIAVLVRDARVLADGRVGAVVEFEVFDDPKHDVKIILAEKSFHVYARVGDRWLLDESVPIDGGA